MVGEPVDVEIGIKNVSDHPITMVLPSQAAPFQELKLLIAGPNQSLERYLPSCYPIVHTVRKPAELDPGDQRTIRCRILWPRRADELLALEKPGAYRLKVVVPAGGAKLPGPLESAEVLVKVVQAAPQDEPVRAKLAERAIVGFLQTRSSSSEIIDRVTGIFRDHPESAYADVLWAALVTVHFADAKRHSPAGLARAELLGICDLWADGSDRRLNAEFTLLGTEKGTIQQAAKEISETCGVPIDIPAELAQRCINYRRPISVRSLMRLMQKSKARG
jgi:hypothetical protein